MVKALENRVAIITGSGVGMGKATALAMAQEGAKVVVNDIIAESAERVADEIRANGAEAIPFVGDISNFEIAEKLIRAAVENFGKVDILHNNAGIAGRFALTAETTEENWDRVLDINLKGVFLGSKYALPVMLSQGGGIIINTASVDGLLGMPGVPAYCASKAGVILLTKTMALEYARQNIRVNCICPGLIQTPINEPFMGVDPAAQQALKAQPSGRMGQPEEIARTALYLACDDSSFVNGAALVVDGAWTVGVSMPRPKTG